MNLRNRTIVVLIVCCSLVFIMSVYAERKAAQRAHDDMIRAVLSDAPIYPKTVGGVYE